MQPSFFCDDCLTKYSTRSNLTSHINRVHLVLSNTSPRMPLECDDCSTELSYKSGLRSHILETIHCSRIGKKKAKTALQCDDCCSIISTKAHLKRHIVTRHLMPINPDLQLRCDVCSTSYRERATMLRHLLHLHKVVDVVRLADVECDVCGLSATARKADFTAHIYTHPPFHLDLWRCDHCTSQSSGKHNLVLHLNFVHVKKNQLWKWQCDCCQMKTQFYQKGHLVRHVICRHLETTASLRCDHCAVLFAKDSLVKHLDVHSPIRLIWRCDYCPTRQFVGKDGLAKHLDVHSLSRPIWRCDCCPTKQFVWKRGVMQHVTTEQHLRCSISLMQHLRCSDN